MKSDNRDSNKWERSQTQAEYICCGHWSKFWGHLCPSSSVCVIEMQCWIHIGWASRSKMKTHKAIHDSWGWKHGEIPFVLLLGFWLVDVCRCCWFFWCLWLWWSDWKCQHWEFYIYTEIHLDFVFCFTNHTILFYSNWWQCQLTTYNDNL